MPIYEYECTACGAHHEIIRKFSDPPLGECPACGGKLRKLISTTSFVLKGSGWYVTDYASPERKKAAEAEKQGGDAKTPDAKSEPKTETKAEAKSNGKIEAKSGATASDK